MMSDLDEMDGETRLARITLQIYEVMFDYCEYIHTSFSEMLKSTDDMEMDDEDMVLAKWMREQINILENIFAHNQTRREIMEKFMTEVLAESNQDLTIH